MKIWFDDKGMTCDKATMSGDVLTVVFVNPQQTMAELLALVTDGVTIKTYSAGVEAVYKGLAANSAVKETVKGKTYITLSLRAEKDESTINSLKAEIDQLRELIAQLMAGKK